MASTTGAAAWSKHFEPVFTRVDYVQTIMNKESALYDESGNKILKINKGTGVYVLKTSAYQSKTPITLVENPSTVYYTSFNNIQKPKSKMASGIKLKPQDFPSVPFGQAITNRYLIEQLITDIEEIRTDLEPTLRDYMIDLVGYWGGTMSANQKAEVVKSYKKLKEGKAEVAKDFSELLGALACISNGNLIPGVKVPKDTKIKLPREGNAPLADYFLIHEKFNGGQLTMSAKSGTATNTLKPQDIIKLLTSQNKLSTWGQTDVYKLMKLLTETSTVLGPFYAINFVMKKQIVSDKALLYAKDNFKVANFSNKKYEHALFGNLMKLLGYSVLKPPSIGELFYYTEKKVVEEANKSYNATKIFEAATSGAVTYIKYSISDSKPEGEFTVLVTDGAKADKKNIKWRSKNDTRRAADKIGLQP
jgi:hypothetical protein